MPITLTKHQLETKNKILDLLHTGQIAVLSGISGTGKSTTTKEIIYDFRKLNKIVHVTATTHKAVEVISRDIPLGLSVSTIHSFLNLVRDTTKEGAPLVPNIRKEDNFAQLLVIDEFSMLTEDVIRYLREYMTRNKYTKVLLVGDASQLVLDQEDLKLLGLEDVTVHLTEPMRQSAMSDIAMYSKVASEAIMGTGPAVSIPWGDEVIKYEKHEDFIQAWKNTKTPDKAILAFSNKTVTAYNRNISKLYRNQELEYMPGNKVILRSSVKTNMKTSIPNRALVKLTSVSDEGEYYLVGSNMGEFRINKTASWIKSQTRQFVEEKNWAKYYDFVEKYVQVHHADAMTCHSSQGDTFEEVFVDATDMMNAPRDVLRLAYVAISRAKSRVHVFVGNKRNYKAFKQHMDDIEHMFDF